LKVFLLAQVDVSRQLLGECRTPLPHFFFGDVFIDGASDSLRIDTGVVVEPFILDSDGRVLKRLGDLGDRDKLFVLGGDPSENDVLLGTRIFVRWRRSQ
jgi:hypothetical protein